MVIFRPISSPWPPEKTSKKFEIIEEKAKVFLTKADITYNMERKANKTNHQIGEINMTAKAKKADKATPNFMDAINANAKVEKKGKAKKVDDSIIQDAPENVKADISKLIKAKKKAKEAKADIASAEGSILTFGKDRHDTEAFAGRFKKSRKIAGNDDDTVNFVTANKWSFSPDDIDDINGILGEDNADLIEKDYVVKINGEVFTDEKKQKELMELLGDRWNDFFETTVTYKVSENFDEAIYKELNAEQVADLKVYMKQSKPSIR